MDSELRKGEKVKSVDSELSKWVTIVGSWG